MFVDDLTRKLAIFSCLLLTSFCFWKVGAGLIGDVDAEILPSAQAAVHPSFTQPRVVTTPIQQMRPGMRLVGRNPLRIQTESTIDPTPEGWRLLSVRMLKPDGTYFEAELLRPLIWIRQHQAQPGAVIKLNMPELHVVGAAEVLSISDCPPIDPGDGPVVLSTFKNIASNILNIYVEGEAGPIGVTAGHPIWSEDRQTFVHSEKLQPGERLRSALGKTVRITSIEIRAGPELVYNLEVAGEHVYQITNAGLLVHNACGRKASRVAGYDPFIVPGPNPNNLRMKIVDPVAGPGKGIGVYIKPHFGKTKVGMVGESKTFRYRYSNKSPEGGGGIEIEISQTRFVKAADDSAYKWTARRQRRFDEEYVDRITPEGAIFRSSTGDTPVKADKWIKYRHIFGYGDVAEDFGR